MATLCQYALPYSFISPSVHTFPAAHGAKRCAIHEEQSLNSSGTSAEVLSFDLHTMSECQCNGPLKLLMFPSNDRHTTSALPEVSISWVP